MINVAEINDLNRLGSFRLLWKELWNRTPGASYVQSYDWFRCYCEQFGYQDRLRTLIVSLAGKPIGIVPLILKSRQTAVGSLRVLTYPAGWDTGRYGPLGRHTTAVLLAAVQHAQQTRRDWDLLDFGPAGNETDDSRIANAFRTAGTSSSRIRSASVPQILTEELWEEYWHHRPEALKQQVQSAIDSGRFRYVRFRPEGTATGETDRCWELYRHFEALGESNNPLKLSLAKTDEEQFLRNVHPFAVDAGAVDMNLLFEGNRAVAAAYNYVHEGLVECVNFRTSLESSSAATSLLMFNMIRDGFERDDRSISLQRVAGNVTAGWQTKFGATYRRTHFAALAPRAQLLRLQRAMTGWLHTP